MYVPINRLLNTHGDRASVKLPGAEASTGEHVNRALNKVRSAGAVDPNRCSEHRPSGVNHEVNDNPSLNELIPHFARVTLWTRCNQLRRGVDLRLRINLCGVGKEKRALSGPPEWLWRPGERSSGTRDRRSNQD